MHTCLRICLYFIILIYFVIHYSLTTIATIGYKFIASIFNELIAMAFIII